MPVMGFEGASPQWTFLDIPGNSICLATGLRIEDVFVSDGNVPLSTGAAGMGCPPPEMMLDELRADMMPVPPQVRVDSEPVSAEQRARLATKTMNESHSQKEAGGPFVAAQGSLAQTLYEANHRCQWKMRPRQGSVEPMGVETDLTSGGETFVGEYRTHPVGICHEGVEGQACEAKLSAIRQKNEARQQKLEELSALVVKQQEIINRLEGQAVASSPSRTGRCAWRKSLSQSLLEGGCAHARHALGHQAKKAGALGSCRD